MSISDTREWLSLEKTKTFLEKPIEFQSEWFTIYKRLETCFEEFIIFPALISASKHESSLIEPGWATNVMYPKITFFKPQQYHFLSLRIRRFLQCDNNDFVRSESGGNYKHKQYGKFLELTINDLGFQRNIEIKIKINVLRIILNHFSVILLLGLTHTRYTERSIEELDLHTSRNNKKGVNFVYGYRIYDLSALPILLRERMLTRTEVIGKKIIKSE